MHSPQTSDRDCYNQHITPAIKMHTSLDSLILVGYNESIRSKRSLDITHIGDIKASMCFYQEMNYQNGSHANHRRHTFKLTQNR